MKSIVRKIVVNKGYFDVFAPVSTAVLLFPHLSICGKYQPSPSLRYSNVSSRETPPPFIEIQNRNVPSCGITRSSALVFMNVLHFHFLLFNVSGEERHVSVYPPWPLPCSSTESEVASVHVDQIFTERPVVKSGIVGQYGTGGLSRFERISSAGVMIFCNLFVSWN